MFYLWALKKVHKMPSPILIAHDTRWKCLVLAHMLLIAPQGMRWSPQHYVDRACGSLSSTSSECLLLVQVPTSTSAFISCGFLFVLVLFHIFWISQLLYKGPLFKYTRPSTRVLPSFHLKDTQCVWYNFRLLFSLPELISCWILIVSSLPRSVVGIHCIFF